MIKYFLIFLFSGVYLTTNAQEQKKMWTEDEISDISVLLYRKVSDSTSKTGTATLITYSDRYFLLTAAHVSKAMDQSSKIVFRLDGDLPLIKELKQLSKNIIVSWKEHEKADMAMIELKLPSDTILRERFLKIAFPYEQINMGKDLPSRRANLTFLGYPVLDLGLEYFSPLIFEASLSSGLITQFRYDEKSKKSTFFYLSKPSIQGCSGSGIFFAVNKTTRRTMLIGVMHGTKSDNTGGKLAAITPSFYISDLLALF